MTLRYKPFDFSGTALRPAIDLFTEALFLSDPSDQIILANNAAQTLTGLPESALLGKPIATILSLQLSHQEAKANRITLPTAELLTLPATIHALKYSATFVPLLSLAYFAEFTPRPAALVVVSPISSSRINDHTTTIYVQFIGHLTMRIAHDLSNSLTSIIGNAELVDEQLNDLINSPTPERCASLRDNGLPELHDVIRKSREMAQFITTLREYARQPPDNTHTLDLNTAINETLTIAGSLLGPKIQIDFLPADDLPPIYMDRFRIDQLLLSILLTCKNAMPSAGRITIETERATLDPQFTHTHPGARQGHYSRLSIMDSSAGMDAEQITRMFDLPASELFDSAGLGMPIAYSIVKRFGGYITLESWPSKGTKFDIYFPSIPTLSTSPIPDERSLPEPLEADTATNTSLILVADDDSDIQRTIDRYLSRAGYQTTFTSDGNTALALYRKLTAEKNQPVLLITDLGLPGMDGRTLATIIQHEFRSARVLLTSGYKIDIDPNGKTQDGFTFLPKPFEPNALITTIEQMLKQKQRQNSSFTKRRPSSPPNHKLRKQKETY